MVGNQIGCIEDWLHSRDIADLGKKSGDGAKIIDRYTKTDNQISAVPLHE